jgi:hypothetical protein
VTVPVAVPRFGLRPRADGDFGCSMLHLCRSVLLSYSALLQRVVARSTVPMGKWVDDELPKLAPHDRPIEVVQEEGDLL